MTYRWIGFALGLLLAGGSAGIARSAVTASTAKVAWVELELEKSIIPANATGPAATTLLKITARDHSGAAILSADSYLDRNGKPLVIRIANSSPQNTQLDRVAFSRPQPSGNASNVAKITYSGRAHFHFPTFTVENPGLPSLPANGVTLDYQPTLAIFGTVDVTPSQCFGYGSFPSVGGYFYGGPYLALAQPRPASCGLPATADVWRMPLLGPAQYYNLNPKHDSVVKLGFGSDKMVYFAINPTHPNKPTEFGYLRRPADRTWANIASVSPLTLGNDGSLWFYGSWKGDVRIGKLPPAGAHDWRPQLFSVPDAANLISLEPGVEKTEVLLYRDRSHNALILARIGTNLGGFARIRVTETAMLSGFGDLLVGPNNTFFVSAGTGNGDPARVYKIDGNGTLQIACSGVQAVVRLADGTGIGYPNPDFPPAVVHVVPATGACSRIASQPGVEPASLDGVDTTTNDWLIYSSPNGHRLGVF